MAHANGSGRWGLRLDVGPLREWLAGRVAALGFAAAGRETGLDEAQVRRLLVGSYIEYGRRIEITTVSIGFIDQVLTRADGPPLRSLYPDLDAELSTEQAWCVACRETCMPIDGVCPWCETPIFEPPTELPPPRPSEAGAHPRRSHGRKKARTVPKPRVGEGGWCPTDAPTLDEGLVPARPARHRRGRLTDELLVEFVDHWESAASVRAAVRELDAHTEHGYSSFERLYDAVGRHVRAAGWRDAATARAALDAPAPMLQWPAPRGLTSALIFEAQFRYYICGYGFLRTARALLPDTTYASEGALADALHRLFRNEGWPRRDRVQATRLASYRHGLAPRDRDTRLGGKANSNYRRWLKHQRGEVQPRCRGKVVQGSRTGRRCLRPALTGKLYCAAHDVANAQQVAARLKSMRAIRDRRLVPIEPFSCFLDKLAGRLGSNCAVASATGLDPTVVSRLRRRMEKGKPKTTVRRDTVDRVLARLGDGTVFEDLYAPSTWRRAAASPARNGLSQAA